MVRSGFQKQTLEQVKAKQASKRAKKLTQSKVPKTPKKRTARQIRRKKGIWATTTADNYFSKWIRERSEYLMDEGYEELLADESGNKDAHRQAEKEYDEEFY